MLMMMLMMLMMMMTMMMMTMMTMMTMTMTTTTTMMMMMLTLMIVVDDDDVDDDEDEDEVHMFPTAAGYESGSLVACYPGERQASCCFWMLPHHPPKSPLTHRFWPPRCSTKSGMTFSREFPMAFGEPLKISPWLK